MTFLIELPNQLLYNIINKLSLADIQHVSKTCKTMKLQIKECFQKNANQQFVFGPWSGTWTSDTMIFNNDALLEKIYCKTIVYRNVDHSNSTYYKIYITLKEDYETSHSFYHHIYFEDFHKWMQYYFNIPRSVIWIMTRVPVYRPLNYYNVPSNYRKRDHCSLIGISLCFHQSEDPRWKNTHFSQRIGFNINHKMNIWTEGFNKIKLYLTSEVMIHPRTHWTSDNKLINEPGTHTIIYFKVTSTECIAKTPNPTSYDSIKEYHDTLELCCNAMYSIIKNNDYEKIKMDAYTKMEELALKIRRSPDDFELDIPKNEAHMWELIQSMKIYQHHYPPEKPTLSESKLEF